MQAFAAGGTTTLEHIEFGLRLPQADTFDKLIQMNQSLREATIIIHSTGTGSDGAVVERVVGITKRFLISPNIKRLEITDWKIMPRRAAMVKEKLRNVCRHRRIEARILDYDEDNDMRRYTNCLLYTSDAADD